jgi:uncharacterized lipoprotein YehR (DUF1307 family)
MEKKLLAIIVLVTVVSLSIAGCTSSTNNNTTTTTQQQSQAVAYANAFGSHVVNNNPNDTTNYNAVANGTDAAQLTITLVNATSTTTYALNVQQFSTTADATTFYNSSSFGYNPLVGAITTTPYTQVIGHTPTVNRASTQPQNNLGEPLNIVMQADEFVVYGTLTITSTG